jgi:hypothetical protein
MGNGADILTMVRRSPVQFVLIALLGGCSDGAGLPPLSSSEVAVPAGPGTSEPFLSATGAGRVHLSWLERMDDGSHEVRLSTFDGTGWSEPNVVHRSTELFVNWADFPSVTAGPDGALWVHWLERGPEGGYGIRITRSGDGGTSWSEPWTPHTDVSSAEHGFVAAVPMGDGIGFVWLDGRAFATAGSSVRAETALYFRRMGPEGPTTDESMIDARVCDCCQTDAAMSAAGPVLVYRDRSPEEIRDVHVTRWDGRAWTESLPVHADGWETGACPVNGPAVDALGERVAVAWFTAARGVPHVYVAFSDDSAETFGEPVIADDGDPSGRVDVVLLDDGSALVTWLERTGGEWSEVRARRIAPDGRSTSSAGLSAASGERVGGFPRMARGTDGRVWIAWTDVSEAESRVRAASIEPAIGEGAR